MNENPQLTPIILPAHSEGIKNWKVSNPYRLFHKPGVCFRRQPNQPSLYPHLTMSVSLHPVPGVMLSLSHQITTHVQVSTWQANYRGFCVSALRNPGPLSQYWALFSISHTPTQAGCVVTLFDKWRCKGLSWTIPYLTVTLLIFTSSLLFIHHAVHLPHWSFICN